MEWELITWGRIVFQRWGDKQKTMHATEKDLKKGKKSVKKTEIENEDVNNRPPRKRKRMWEKRVGTWNKTLVQKWEDYCRCDRSMAVTRDITDNGNMKAKGGLTTVKG